MGVQYTTFTRTVYDFHCEICNKDIVGAIRKPENCPSCGLLACSKCNMRWNLCKNCFPKLSQEEIQRYKTAYREKQKVVFLGVMKIFVPIVLSFIIGMSLPLEFGIPIIVIGFIIALIIGFIPMAKTQGFWDVKWKKIKPKGPLDNKAKIGFIILAIMIFVIIIAVIVSVIYYQSLIS